ncbi:MAG: hypothetical protein ACTSUE_07020, partial [Promethearchaeota archaeon]
MPREYLASRLPNCGYDSKQPHKLVWRTGKRGGTVTFRRTANAISCGNGHSPQHAIESATRRIEYINSILPPHEEKLKILSTEVTNLTATCALSHPLDMYKLITVLPRGSWTCEDETFPSIPYFTQPDQ